jgi:hypothetical protein
MTDQEGQTPPREASEPVSRAEFEALRERVAELEAQVGPSGDILRAVTGAASLHRGTPAWYRSVSGLTLPRSAGRGSTLARERPVALSRGLPSASESSPRGFSPRLSLWRSCPGAHPPARFTPSRGHPITRASRAPQTWVECGPTPAAYNGGSRRNPCVSCRRDRY